MKNIKRDDTHDRALLSKDFTLKGSWSDFILTDIPTLGMSPPLAGAERQ
jgi:hypothetical protein